MALVSVWTGLVIWTDGFVFRWWSGGISQTTGRRLYLIYAVDNPATVARCVAQRCMALKIAHPPRPSIEGFPL